MQDLSQYQRMQSENAAGRAAETVQCRVKDALCARIVQMQGEACAQLANDQRDTSENRSHHLQCTLDDAQLLPALIPTDYSQDDRDRANLLQYEAARAALDSTGNETTVQAATKKLAGMPDGQPFADTLTAYLTTFSVLTGRVPAGQACAMLGAAAQKLPAAPPAVLAVSVASTRDAIETARHTRGCV